MCIKTRVRPPALPTAFTHTLVAIGEHHTLVDGAGQRHREKSRRRTGHHRDRLTGMAEDELLPLCG